MNGLIVMATSDNISVAMSYLGLILLILIIMAKVINVARLGSFYERLHIFTGFIISIFCYFFILIGYLTNFTTDYTIYIYFASMLFVLNTMLFLIEILETFLTPKFRGRLGD